MKNANQNRPRGISKSTFAKHLSLLAKTKPKRSRWRIHGIRGAE